MAMCDRMQMYNTGKWLGRNSCDPSEVLSQHLYGKAEENHEEPDSG
jgi:hypothetical protein